MLTSYYTLCSFAADTPGNNPIPVFSHLVVELRRYHPNFGYLHLVEPRARGSFDRAVEGEPNDSCVLFGSVNCGSRQAGSHGTAQSIKLMSTEN